MLSKYKKKIIIIFILIFFYIIFMLNLHKIKFAVNLIKLYKEEKNINTSIEDSNGKKPIIIENPLESVINSSSDKSASPDLTQIPANNSKPSESTNKTTAQDSNINSPKNNLETNADDINKPYVSIVKEYNIELESLKKSFEDELDALIDQGIAEYTAGKSSNAKLADKYLSLGSKLEKSSDYRFDKVIKNMEKELKQNKHDLSITQEIKNYYKSIKKAKKKDIISRGMKYVK